MDIRKITISLAIMLAGSCLLLSGCSDEQINVEKSASGSENPEPQPEPEPRPEPEPTPVGGCIQDPSAPVPPAPGPNARSTIAGVDTNQNNVRDDVERTIYCLYPNNADKRKAMMRVADAIEDAVQLGTSGSTANSDQVADNISLSIDCLYETSGLPPTQAVGIVKALVLNTSGRLNAYVQYDKSRAGTTQRAVDAPDSFCTGSIQ